MTLLGWPVNALWMRDDDPQRFMAASCPMARVFIGSEELAAGRVTKYELAKRYQRVLPDVYAQKGELSLHDRTVAAWMWSRRQGVVTGAAASAWHGAKWVDADTPIELNLANKKAPRGVITRNDTILADEVVVRRGVPVTTVARTAFDLARRGTEREAIARLDAFARASHFDGTDVLDVARRHPHVRELARVPSVLEQVDRGAESPKESYLRLTLVDAGFPRPQTQIPVLRPDGRRYFLDMGWPELMVAVEYDGEHHRTDRLSFVNDVTRSEYLASVGWLVIRILAGHQRWEIVERVHRARRVRLLPAS
jgi:very-short-patch-repair endonuclease